MRLHAIVTSIAAARAAMSSGATVVQLRCKDVDTAARVAAAHGFAGLGITAVMNDDVDAALAAGLRVVHLGRSDLGAGRARAAGLLVGRSVNTVAEAHAASAEGAWYLGAGPVWATPSKADADPPIGLAGLAAIAAAVAVPVVAIGGIDTHNAAACIEAGAAGVAVIRAAEHCAGLRAAIDPVLAARRCAASAHIEG